MELEAKPRFNPKSELFNWGPVSTNDSARVLPPILFDKTYHFFFIFRKYYEKTE